MADGVKSHVMNGVEDYVTDGHVVNGVEDHVADGVGGHVMNDVEDHVADGVEGHVMNEVEDHVADGVEGHVMNGVEDHVPGEAVVKATPYMTSSLALKRCNQWWTKETNELVIDMTSDRCLPATESLLSQPEMSDEMVVLVFRVFARACECDAIACSLQKLLSKLPKSVYLNRHLSNYLNRMADSSRLDSQERESQLHTMVKTFHRHPQKTTKLVPQTSQWLSLTVVQLRCQALGSLVDVTLMTAVEDLTVLKNEMAGKVKQEAEGTHAQTKRAETTGEEG